MMFSQLQRFLCAILCTALLSSCATIEQNPNTAKLVTQYAVLKFAEQSSPERRIERLHNVVKIATDVKAIAANEVTSISSLRGVVGLQIQKLGLSPADQLLALGLADIVAQELIKKIGTGNLNDANRLVIADVMTWVIEAAQTVS